MVDRNQADPKSPKGAPGSSERCPICGEPTVHKHRPFCSSRCASIDLNRWLTGRYTIPVVDDEDEDGGLPPPGGQVGEA